MVSALDSGSSSLGSSPCRVIVLCSWLRHFTLTVPLSTQVCKWVPAIYWGNLTNCGEVTCDRLASRPGGVEILLAASCYRNRDKLWQLRVSHGSKAHSLHFLIKRNEIDHFYKVIPVILLATVIHQCGLVQKVNDSLKSILNLLPG